MKNSKVLKILLILLILIIACTISTKAEANYSITYSGVAWSNEFFCRQRGATLNSNVTYTYVNDGNSYKLGYGGNGYTVNTASLGWAYLFAKNQYTNYAVASTIRGSTLQKNFWFAINDDQLSTYMNYAINNKGIARWNNSGYSLLQEAYNYAQKGEQIANNENAKLNATGVTKNVEEQIIGPFSISNCAYAEYNNKLIGGISELKVFYKKDNNIYYPEFTIVSKGENQKNDALLNWYCSDTKKLTASNNFKDMKKFNDMSKNFYIKLRSDTFNSITSISLEAICNYLKPYVTIQPICNINNNTQKLVYIKSKLNNGSKTLSTSEDIAPSLTFDLKKYDFLGNALNGAKFEIEAYQKNDNGVTPLSITSTEGESKITFTVHMMTESQNKDNIYIRIKENVAPDGYAPLTKDINMVWTYKENGDTYSWGPTACPNLEEWNTMYESLKQEDYYNELKESYELWVNNIEIIDDTRNILKKFITEDLYRQISFDDLLKNTAIVVALNNLGITNEEAQELINDWNNTYPSLKSFDFWKREEYYNDLKESYKLWAEYIGTDPDDNFKISDELRNTLKSYIEEESCPYRKYSFENWINTKIIEDDVAQELNDELINKLSNAWKNECQSVESYDSWVAHNSTYGGWKWIDDGANAFPNTYVTFNDATINKIQATDGHSEFLTNEKSINEADYKKYYQTGVDNKIVLIKETNSPYVIEVYDKIIPIKINLKKFNSYFAENKQELDGAKFRVYAVQGNNATPLYDVNGVSPNNMITIQPNSTEDVFVTITETTAPAGCEKLKNSINLRFVYASETKSWEPNFAVPNTYQDKFNNSFAYWSYLRTPNDYNSNLPNVYCTDSKSSVQETKEDAYMNNEGECWAHEGFYEFKPGDIYSANNVNGCYEISIYNNLCLIDITLLKVDQYYNGKLDGATFSGSITNIKSFNYNNTTYNSNDKNTFSFTNWEITNGELKIHDALLADSEKDVVITLNETKVPIKCGTENIECDDDYKFSDLQITISLNPVTATVTRQDNKTSEKGLLVRPIIGEKDDKLVLEITIPNRRIINIQGIAWLDGDTTINNKLNGEGNGIKEDNEKLLKDILVNLLDSQGRCVKSTKTNQNGEYEFRKIEYDPAGYKVEFIYDGVHYEDTKYNVAHNQGEIISNAKEDDSENGDRAIFNKKFQTIAKSEATNSKIPLEYATHVEEGVYKSELITKDANGDVKNNFIMSAKSNTIVNSETINCGLVTRGTDLALHTDVKEAKVSINGKDTIYAWNGSNNLIVLNSNTRRIKTNKDTSYVQSDTRTNQNSTDISYNLNLRSSDYYYRIRDYVTNASFAEDGYTDNNDSGNKPGMSGQQLEVYVTYELDLTNQRQKELGKTSDNLKTYVKEVKYYYDTKYAFDSISNNEGLSKINIDDNNGILTLSMKEGESGIALGTSATQSVELTFKVKPNVNGYIDLGTDLQDDYHNYAEITKYSTDSGLIDIDSAPGNFDPRSPQYEDDSDSAKGINVLVKDEKPRVISGYVKGIKKDDQGNKITENVNDVIVQLIELKKLTEIRDLAPGETNRYFEYIWQETVSGKNVVRRMSDDGTAITTYNNSVGETAGKYEFTNFIPGNYIVRFIYGDGTYYDEAVGDTKSNILTNILKYNGQDYKSTVDSHYTEEWYKTNNYSDGASVARDNEARRLETMAWSTEVDRDKGLLLKLLDVQSIDDLNVTEIRTLINSKNIAVADILNLRDKEKTAINTAINDLREETLANTWMCAETSKLQMGVEENTSKAVYRSLEDKINFTLEERPATSIELKKYITGFTLTAVNGQTLVNAKIDAAKYLNGAPISEQIEGIRKDVVVADDVWTYEVDPTEINTIVEGSSLEFEYTVSINNCSDEDYLSETLMTAYEGSGYATTLKNTASGVKSFMRLAESNYENHYKLGTYLGQYYYTGTKGTNDVPTTLKVTDVRDYINNDLQIACDAEGNKLTNVAEDIVITENTGVPAYILNDDNSLGTINLNTVFDTKINKNIDRQKELMYSVKLSPKYKLSTGGIVQFENYIAEVMKYTNAVGRRADSTPANAEFISEARESYGKIHEKDEADTGTIQVGAATGKDEKTAQIIAISIVISTAIVGLGVIGIKKYVLK